MKKALALLSMFLLILSAKSQTDNTKGQVIYEVVKKLEIKTLGESSKQFQDILPKELKSSKLLVFSPEISLYQNIQKDNNDEEVVESGGTAIMMKFSDPSEIVYSDLKSKINLEQREFLTRTFLIEGKTDTIQWKLTGNQKTIQEYNCLEAELVGSKKKTFAWFTPMIPVSTGPNGFAGLPGLILALDIDNGSMTYTAQKVELKDVDPTTLTKPKEGKRVTRKEFNRIVDEKKKEMDMEHGGNGHIVIRTM